ncbi:MAG: hypothetical protein IPL62_18950 [Caulobacteraceae bacterium]|nr:hypothetical protein [Caulobacteraceae bacterium]MBK8545420.1 hypothetical protein [Caulobacteraceae bacterium]MBP6690673.1 hypothetical protein [Hyphomonadaceae bacterium]
MIKKLSTLSVMALAFAATPALAQTGHVGLSYTSNDDFEYDTTAIEGAAAFAFGENFGAQIDGNIASVDDGGDSETGYRVNGHLFYNAGAARIGGLFGYSKFDYSGIAPEATHWGVEGQYDFGRFTLGASAIWGDAEGIISPELDYEQIDLRGNYYVTDNFVLGARYGFGNVENIGGDADTTDYSLDAEYQFSSTPISLLASFQHWEVDGTAVESDSFTIGARWNWGGTLKERDGAGFRNTPRSVVENFFGTP